MAVKIVEESAVLTLDFWDKEVIYSGQLFPVGTLACDALNIPGEVVSHMEKLCGKLNSFMKSFDSGKGDPALLPEARFSAMKLLELMAQYKPFSYINMEIFRSLTKRVFTPDSVKSANALLKAQRNNLLSDQVAEKYVDGALLSRLLPTLAHFGYSLKAFQETMIPFAQMLHDSERRSGADYAKIFNDYFPKEPTFEDAGGWMSMTNVTMQYLTIEHPEGDQPILVTRSHYVSFVGMLRGDFFEALRVGHAVKRCLNCNRWFLTTNAQLVKYCDGLAPGDLKGRTCRSVGAKNGYKEDAKAHPIKGPYVTRRNTISKYVSKGAMSEELGAIALRLTDEKRTRAFTDHDYFLNHYEEEMSQKSIVAEAKQILAAQSAKEGMRP